MKKQNAGHLIGAHLGVDHKKLVIIEQQLLDWLATEFFDDTKIEGCECDIIRKTIELCKETCTTEELATAIYVAGNRIGDLVERALEKRHNMQMSNKKEEVN